MTHQRIDSSQRETATPSRSELAPEVIATPEGELQALASTSPQVRSHLYVQAIADGSSQVTNAASHQRRADAVHRSASHGTRGLSEPLPHLQTLQGHFGHHDLSGVQAHLGGAAREATQAMGAKAYATGEHVVFQDRPSLFMAAHEAAHVVQQRGGLQLFGGLGQAGDVHERHADEVARLVERGESAEAALDRYADPSRPRLGPTSDVQRSVQCWGEPDHYAMGQLAGKKAVEVLDSYSPKDTDYHVTSTDIAKPRTVEPDGKGLSVTEDDKTSSSTRFMIRDSKGLGMSYGAANRFAGDLSGQPTRDIKRSPGLMSWPGKLTDTDYGHISKFKEYGLMATNANHFYPLAGIEYRRQHAHAKQLMAMAVAIREAATGSSEINAAKELSRQALMFEGFAGHFLADCFAAGHLTPHALGRIKLRTHGKAWAGGMVNTWHDIFNAIPGGIPTTLGRFHGDYSMDGDDLEYVSSVLSNSLLEIAMPWYTGLSYDPELVLPRPDIDKIKADPVVGALWAQMTKDYSGRMKALEKLGLDTKAVYQTTSGERSSGDEVITPILEHVFGGSTDGIETNTYIGTDLEVIRGSVLQLVNGIHAMLGQRGGVQVHSGLTQGFEPLSTEEIEELPFKFRVDLQSDNPLKHTTPATPPMKPLLAELGQWLRLWEIEAKKLVDEPKVEAKLRTTLPKFLTVLTRLDDIGKLDKKDRPKAKLELRTKSLKFLGQAKKLFESVPVTIPKDLPKVIQGPGTSLTRGKQMSEVYKKYLEIHRDRTLAAQAMAKDIKSKKLDFNAQHLDSGRIVSISGGAVRFMLDRYPKALPSYFELGRMLDTLAADPRPRSTDHFKALYGLVHSAAKTFNSALTEDVVKKEVSLIHLPEVEAWAMTLMAKLEEWHRLALKKPKSKKIDKLETKRRAILWEMSKFLNAPLSCLATISLDDVPMFSFSADKLLRTTGRTLGIFSEGEELDFGSREDVIDSHDTIVGMDTFMSMPTMISTTSIGVDEVDTTKDKLLTSST